MAAIHGIDEYGIPVETGVHAIRGGFNIFLVQGGPIIILQFVSYCITANTSVTTVGLAGGWNNIPNSGGFICDYSASLAGMQPGTAIVYPFGFSFPVLETATIATTGTGIATEGGYMVPKGNITIESTLGPGPTDGTFKHFMRWVPMSPGSSVLIDSEMV